MTAIAVRPAQAPDLEALVELFDAYRVYYRQPSSRRRVRAFLESRLKRQDSVILIADSGAASPAGFTQLYPSFSSVALARLWILNDLYVDAGARRRGVATALLEAARRHALATGAVRLVLETLPDNAPAQALYRKLGWTRGQTWHFELELSPGPD